MPLPGFVKARPKCAPEFSTSQICVVFSCPAIWPSTSKWRHVAFGHLRHRTVWRLPTRFTESSAACSSCTRHIPERPPPLAKRRSDPYPHDDCAGPGTQCANPSCRWSKADRPGVRELDVVYASKTQNPTQTGVVCPQCGRRYGEIETQDQTSLALSARRAAISGAGTIRGRSDHDELRSASPFSMRTLLLELFFLLTGNRLVLQAPSCVMTEWINTGLSECKASVVPHGLFWMRFTHPAGVAITGHGRMVPGLLEKWCCVG